MALSTTLFIYRSTMNDKETLQAALKKLGVKFKETEWKGDKVVVIAHSVNFNFDRQGHFKDVKVWNDT